MQQARKQQGQARQDKLQQQAIANALAKARLGIDANNSGMVFDPVTGSVKPWTPPANAATPPQGASPGSTPGMTTLPAKPEEGPLPTGTSPGSKPGMTTLPAKPQTGPAKVVNFGQGQVDPDLIQGVNQAKAMAASLTGVYQSEMDQVKTLTAQGAPKVLIEQHRAAAHDALVEAGTWTGKQLEGEKEIYTQQHRNDPAKPTWADTHPTYSQQHPQAPKPTWADIHGTYGERHPRPKEDPNAPTAIENRIYALATAPGLTRQQSLKIIDNPNNGLNYKQRTSLRQAINDQKPDTQKKDTENPDNTTMASHVLSMATVLKLPLADQSDLNTNIRRYGYGTVVGHLKDLANGKASDPSTPPDRAKRILSALGEQ